MKKYFKLAIIIFACNTQLCFSEDIQGAYVCKSKEVGTNQIYTGNLALKKTGDTYTTRSKFSDGSTYHGTGIYDSQKNIFATVAVNPANANEIGLALYTFQKNGSMSVKWTYLNRIDISTARCQKVKDNA